MVARQLPRQPQVNVRTDESFLRLLDDWRRKQQDVPARPEAIRRLVHLALKRTTVGSVSVRKGITRHRKSAGRLK